MDASHGSFLSAVNQNTQLNDQVKQTVAIILKEKPDLAERLNSPNSQTRIPAQVELVDYCIQHEISADDAVLLVNITPASRQSIAPPSSPQVQREKAREANVDQMQRAAVTSKSKQNVFMGVNRSISPHRTKPENVEDQAPLSPAAAAKFPWTAPVTSASSTPTPASFTPAPAPSTRTPASSTLQQKAPPSPFESHPLVASARQVKSQLNVGDTVVVKAGGMANGASKVIFACGPSSGYQEKEWQTTYKNILSEAKRIGEGTNGEVTISIPLFAVDSKNAANAASALKKLIGNLPPNVKLQFLVHSSSPENAKALEKEFKGSPRVIVASDLAQVPTDILVIPCGHHVSGSDMGVTGTKMMESIIANQKNTGAALKSLLRDPLSLNKNVQTLVDRGKKTWEGKVQKDKKYGGRSADWVRTTFGRDEKAIRTELIEEMRAGRLAPPQPFSVGTIGSLYQPKTPAAGAQAQIGFRVGLSINDLHLEENGRGRAVVQLASQFDYQESQTTQDASVESYRIDLTQGPQGSIEAGAAALHRKAAKDAGQLPHALEKCISKSLLDKCYINGYLNLKNLSEKDQKQLLDELKENIHNLQILPQRAICERSGGEQLQVFTAAPSFQGTPKPTPLETEICKLLVVEQYKALAQLAVIRGSEGGAPVPLHLTLVGQGSFANDPSIMGEALKAVAEVVKGQNVQVTYQFYDSRDIAKFMQGAQDAQAMHLVPKDLLEAVKNSKDPQLQLFVKAATEELTRRG